MSVQSLLHAYAQRIRELRRANQDVPETALAPAFQQLLEGLLRLIPVAANLVVVPEYRNPGVGRPDVALVRPGAPARAFVELKAPMKSADPTRWRDHDKLQFERFQELPCWAIANFSEIRLFHRGEEVARAAIIPERALSPDQDDTRADRVVAAHDGAALIDLIEKLCVGAGQEPNARDAEHLAALMAHSARLVRGIVRDRLAELRVAANQDHPLLQVRQEFRDVLYSHPEAAGYSSTDFDLLFSAAFAQTLAFGLLLVREGTGRLVEENAWQHMPGEHPLMRTALRVLTLPEVVADIGIGFTIMRDTVNSFAPEILEGRPDKPDPILYFYEDFLKTFDRDARERYGVYYTPLEVVRFMVGALDRALRERLRTQGLRDGSVTILDPATGTGTFLLGIGEHVRMKAEAEAGEGLVPLALHDLASRMFGFELLVGPYAVAHYRLHHALRQQRGKPGYIEPAALPRLGIYLADTLAEPNAATPLGRLGFVSEGILEERRAANRIKAEQPILAIIGNPPYRRLETGENRTLVGDWLDQIWDDLKEPVRRAGQGNQLNTFPELSVAFWRWAIWKLFEAENAPRRGVVAFITNRKFLTGWPYAGLRKLMRERFDRIEITDLRGDVRRGERAGVQADQGVFNIQVGTAITLAVADGSKAAGAAADILYLDAWTEGRFSRAAKFDWLAQGVEAGTLPNAVAVKRGLLDDMRSRPFYNGEWISIHDCFNFASSGLESKRDAVVYAVSCQLLEMKIRAILGLEGEALDDAFNSTSMNTAHRAVSTGWNVQFTRLNAYRPFDRRWHFTNDAWNDRPRPALRSRWGSINVCLFALPNGTSAGPAVWSFGNYPDRHAFRGSYGGYAFPLHDRRPDVNASNISQTLIQGLSIAYGEQVAAEDAFDAILALLSATSYSLRFAEDLEDVFPHVSFSTHHTIFQDAVLIGREIRAVETFARAPTGAFAGRDFVRLATPPNATLAANNYVDGSIVLCGNGSGRVVGLPKEVWDFCVSGYRVLPRWLEGRVGVPVDLELVREFRDICGRISELIELFAEADIVLEATLQQTLSREVLGFDLAG